MASQPSIWKPKPADWESWSKERRKEWWAPRNVARKARKLATRQRRLELQKAVETASRLAYNAKTATKSAEEAAEKVKQLEKQERAEKAAAEKTVLTTGARSQYPRLLTSQQHRPAGYTQFGRGRLPYVTYRALRKNSNPHTLEWGTHEWGSLYTMVHPPPSPPAEASPLVTAGALPIPTKVVQKPTDKRIESRAEENQSESVEQALERVRGEERKKMEDERMRI